MKIKRFIELYKTFSPRVAFSAAAASRFFSASPWKHKTIVNYLKNKYADFISDYKSKLKKYKSKNHETSGIIWTMWWQGEENLPETVKICHASVRENCKSHDFKIITKENFRDYINLPDYIFEKVDAGIITLTHFSDIMRFYLLFNYGGLWLDSTVFVTNEISESIFESEYYTVKRPLTPKNRNVAQDRWTNFLQASEKANILCGFVLDFFLEYWKTQKTLIDYFLIDYTIEIAIEEIPECRDILNNVPVVDYDLYRLENVLNKKWNAEIFSSVKNSTCFSKLSWRKSGRKKTFSGYETVYGHLAKNLISR